MATDRSAVGRKSKRKGANGERELAKLLNEYGYECRRGCQFNGKGAADVIGLPGIHIECKRVEHLDLYGALDQSLRDTKGIDLSTVFHRRNNKPWIVSMPMEQWILLYRLSGLGEENGKQEFCDL